MSGTTGGKDVSMLDFQDALETQSDNGDSNGDKSVSQSFSQMNLDADNGVPSEGQDKRQESGQQPFTRNKSKLIFDDDDDIPPYSNHEEHVSDITSDSGDEQTHSSGHTVFSENSQSSQQQASQQQQQQQQTQSRANVMVPVDITWQQGGEKVYVTGSFTGWRKMIGLVPVPGQPNVLHVKLQLTPGTHKFRFIVDNELRFSDYLPTATDQMGNFVNYLEAVPVAQPHMGGDVPQNAPDSVQHQQNQQPPHQNQQQHAQVDEQMQNDSKNSSTTKKLGKRPMSARSQIAFEIEQEPDDMGDGFSRFKEETPTATSLEYTQDIPAVFTDPTVMEQYYLTLDQQQNNHQNLSWLTPPQLPPHLENVILNSYSNSQSETGQNNSGSLPIPNHVVLNHLATSSIKHNTLCVASIVRYRRKYVTQILFAPLQ